MINQVILTGHLGGDPEFRQVGANDTDLATFSLAVNNYNPNGEDTTIWVKAQLWGGMSKWASDLGTGDRVTISGQLDINDWTNDNGEQRREVRVNVRGIHVPKRDSTSGERTRSKATRSTRSKKKKKTPF